MADLMYVILEWNQAGGAPKVYTGLRDEPYNDLLDAMRDANLARSNALPRNERYTVHEIDMDEVHRA